MLMISWNLDSDAIYIPNPKAYGLAKGMQPPPQSLRPPGNATATSNFYFVSNLHKFHCLVRNLPHHFYLSFLQQLLISMPLSFRTSSADVTGH
jgi:hypothetical protein